jgi:hypothetical protein
MRDSEGVTERPLPPRDVRLIVAAVALSAVGDFLLWIPLTLHLRSMTDSGFAVAGLMICLWARWCCWLRSPARSSTATRRGGS